MATSWCWGRDAGVSQNETADLSEGSGSGIVSDSGDEEVLTLIGNEDWTLPSKNFGVAQAMIKYDEYDTGSGAKEIIEYRTGVDQEACELEAWVEYTDSFWSLGWVQIRFRVEGNLALSIGGALLLDDGSDHLKL